MTINLNKKGGLERLAGAAPGAVGGLSTLLTSLTGAIGSSWDIDEGSYGHDGDQVLFHVFKTSTDDFQAAVDQVQDTGGRRKVPIVFPYVDGQSTDDLGRKGEFFDFNILIHGPNYKQQYADLLQEFDDPRPGTLVHPVRGPITAVAEDWVVTHASDKKQAVALRVRFTEHSFSVDYSQIQVSKSVPSALTSALSFIGKISSAITFVESLQFISSNTRNLVRSILSGYQTSYLNAMKGLNRTFNTGGSTTIPGLNPVVPGQSAEIFNVTTTTTDVFNGTDSLIASQTSQSQQLTQALATQQAVDVVKQLRTDLETGLEQIEATEAGQGSLIFYDQILMLKQSATAMQDVLELGVQTSNNTIVSYETPRDMSVREVCFANGLGPDSSEDVETLNPDLLSLNLIPKGTTVQVPV